MANSKNLKMFARYDGSGRVIPGSNVLRKNKPKVGNWKEIQTYECCDPFLTTTSTTTEAPLQALRLTFDSIENADLLVGDSSSVEDWNTFFDLPTNGNLFTSVEVVGNEVRLFGGSDIMMDNGGDYTNNLFSANEHIIRVEDAVGCITGFGEGVFYDTINLEWVEFTASNIDFSGGGYLLGADVPGQKLTYVSFPNVTTIVDDDDYGVLSYIGDPDGILTTTFNLPNVIELGPNCFDGDHSLKTANFPQLTIAGDGCFNFCKSLTTIILPQLTTAGDSCFTYCWSLTTINLPNLTNADNSCFYDCSSITTVNLPNLTNAGGACFYDCSSITTVNLPLCTDLGGTVGNNNVFTNINGNTITATFNSVLATNNGGNPDGDIQYLEANNTVTITYV